MRYFKKEHKNVLVSLSHTTLGHREEPDRPWSPSIISEDTIRENLKKHKEAILRCLVPSQLYKLLSELHLDEVSTTTRLKRSKQAEILLDEVVKASAFFQFLEGLEEDTEHMGHKYIVSLLRGEKFATEEEIQLSETFRQQMKKELNSVLQSLNVKELIPHLQTNQLITNEEQERLTNPYNTSEEQTRILFSILKTKGPTAFYLLVEECLAKEESHLRHKDLYQLLTAVMETRKRGADDSSMVSKRYPCLLDPPEGITTETYMEMIAQIRQDHMKGGQRWEAAENTINGEIGIPDNPLEMKIALLLESCNLYVLNRQPDEVLARVDRAREMCMSLYRQEGNAQVLEGRCEWVLARLYKFKGDFERAKTHIDTAYSLTANCAIGEEKILINFVNGSILLDSKKSRQDLRHAIASFESAITLASEEDYGMNMGQYCKIRLAQAYVGSSLNDPAKSREGLSQHNIDNAKRVLRDLEHTDMRHRTRWSYLLTCSDVYRLDGQMDQANAYADRAFDWAQEHELGHEVKSKFVEYRQKYLKDT